jgi:hypothetical protein
MVIPLVSLFSSAATALADNLNLREGANGRKSFWLDVIEKKGD